MKSRLRAAPPRDGAGREQACSRLVGSVLTWRCLHELRSTNLLRFRELGYPECEPGPVCRTPDSRFKENEGAPETAEPFPEDRRIQAPALALKRSAAYIREDTFQGKLE